MMDWVATLLAEHKAEVCVSFDSIIHCGTHFKNTSWSSSPCRSHFSLPEQAGLLLLILKEMLSQSEDLLEIEISVLSKWLTKFTKFKFIVLFAGESASYVWLTTSQQLPYYIIIIIIFVKLVIGNRAGQLILITITILASHN